MAISDTIPFIVQLPPADVVTLCAISQKPYDEQSIGDMMRVMTITAKISHLAVDTAKKIDPNDVAEWQAELEARKRNTIDDIEDDLSVCLSGKEDYINKQDAAVPITEPASSTSYNVSLERRLQHLQLDEPFVIVIHNIHTNKYWPAWIGNTTLIVELAQKIEGTEGIPLQRMRLMHKGNDLSVTARSKANPLADDSTFGYYNVRPGDLVSLSVITGDNHMPREVGHMEDHAPHQAIHMPRGVPSPFTSPSPPRRADRPLSTIQEEGSIKQRPYGRAVSTHKLVTKSSLEGALHHAYEVARRRTEVRWPQEQKLQKARSLDALHVASPVVSPVSFPVGLGISGSGEQRGRGQAREMGPPNAMLDRVPVMPSPPVRKVRRDSIVPSTGSPLPSYMRPTTSSRRVGATASSVQQPPRHRSRRQSVVRSGRTAGGPPAMRKEK